MNVFDLRARLIDDYSAYVRSFISIRDERIHEKVDRDLDEGLLWRHPRIALNPAFAEGEGRPQPRGAHENRYGGPELTSFTFPLVIGRPASGVVLVLVFVGFFRSDHRSVARSADA